MTTTLNASTAGAGGFIATSDNSGVLALQTTGTTAITVDASQNVGIGTSSPAYRLDAISTGGTQTARFRSGDTATTVDIASFERSDSAVRAVINYNSSDGAMTYGTSTNHPIAFKTNNTERMRIDSSGRVLVGITSTRPNGGQVQVAANGQTGLVTYTTTSSGNNAAYFENPNGIVGSIFTNGSATAYNTSSDYRLKENIAPMTGALAKVAQLKPVKYKWKVDGADGEGFIAHELAEVCPHAVSGEKDAVDAEGNPQYQGIDVSFLVATLTAALQELKAINDTQAETINALTARIVALEQKGTV